MQRRRLVACLVAGLRMSCGIGALPTSAPDTTPGPTAAPAVATTQAPNGTPLASPRPGVAACDSGRPLKLLPPDPAADPSNDFVDPVTGHRIVRLSRLENGGVNFYFHQNEFNCRGNKLVFANAHGDLGRWLYTIDLETLEIQPLAESSAPIMEVVAPRRNEVIYLAQDGSLRATNLDTRRTRTIAQLPAGANGFTVNADETLIAGYWNEGIADYQARYPSFGGWFSAYSQAHLRSYVYTVDADTGEVRKIHEESNWIDHTQFSPTDPSLLMFSHEGPAEFVTARSWLINASTASGPRALHNKSDPHESANHEFFSPDGAAVYFDHWMPTDGYSIGRLDVASGALVDLPISASDWGLHYNISPNGMTFASDGDHRGRKTVLLYRLVDGRLQTEELANLTSSDYEFQPLVQFTRDGNWVIYETSQGPSENVWAVEVTKG